MLKRLMFISSCLLSATLAAAETKQSNVYIPFGVMYYNLDSDRGMQNTVMPELGIGYRINDKWATEVIYASGDSNSTRPAGRDVDLSQLRVDLLHFYNDWMGFTPYSVVGLGMNDYDSTANKLNNDDDGIINIGAGLLKNINENWSVRSDIRGIHSLEENQSEYAVNVMFQYNFAACRSKVSTVQESAPMPRREVAAPKVVAEIPAEKLKEKVTISLSVNFDSSSSVVKPQYNNEIQRVAEFMKKYSDANATIEGYTDDRGDAGYNQKLSQRRADAIRKVLIDTYGADGSHLKAVGYGESKPIADNTTREGQLKNRRVTATFEN